MFHLMKKNSYYFVQPAILIPFLTAVWLIKPRPLDTYPIFMGGMWLILAVLNGTIGGEMIEHKMKGYAFLRNLPIRDRDIVMSKFLMAGLSAGIFVLHINILFGFLTGPAHLFALGRILIPIFAGITLLLVALLYILVYSIGYSRFIKIAWATFFVAILFPILFLEFVLPRLRLDFGKIIDSIICQPWSVWVAAGIIFIAAYYGLMQLAIKAKKARA